jgi:hypothetical protein
MTDLATNNAYLANTARHKGRVPDKVRNPSLG